jgi:thymidylate synthase (FAD)
MINRKDNIFGDRIAYVEQYDFSRGNLSHENRVGVVTQVASICYGNEKTIGSQTLYNKLEQESLGLPSSSFEFVPVLIRREDIEFLSRQYDIVDLIQLHMIKFGEVIHNKQYLLTNLRALLHDGIFSNDYFNTEVEAEIIAKYYKVFRSKLDLNTTVQLLRHRTANFQQLSRRYVSNSKKPFEFYVPIDWEEREGFLDLHNGVTLDLYSRLVGKYKKEQARRCIPQFMYTEIWHGWTPNALRNFFELRLNSHAQREIRWLAEAMKELLNNE